MSAGLRTIWSLFVVCLLGTWLAGCGSAGSFPAENLASAAEEPAGGQPSRVNRLGTEASPYLKLHAHNPVDWYPWGPEALQKAIDENKPIFLSIGYSSCFWCHVMEREVFENPEIAAYMNEHFVNIKVDREERPDLDDIYMLALQIYLQAVGSSDGGGWPLSIFLTPEGKPIAGGTYFPPEDKPGRPGFPTVLQTVRTMWDTQEEAVRRSAEVFAGEVRRLSRPPLTLEPVHLHPELVSLAVEGVMERYDPEYGGLDFHAARPESAKFPVPPRLMLLQSRLREGHDESLAGALDHTLRVMSDGGIYDHLGGGFHRYSTDRRWLVPHFEKMLYDNAQLIMVYADAYARTNFDLYRMTAEQSIEFVLRELRDPLGGFYSALDAETDGVEGAHYVWSREQIDSLLGPELGEVLAVTYGLNQPQTFEHGLILHRPQTFTESARQLQMPVGDLLRHCEHARGRLLEARQLRPALLVDDKVLVSWNGLMISALARSAHAIGRPELLEPAQTAARFILTRMRDEQGRLLHVYCDGRAYLPAYLDDYACLIQALLDLHQATGNVSWLTEAQRLMEQQILLFWDSAGRGFFFTGNDQEQLLARTKDAYDSVMPSGNGLSALNLVRLARLTGEQTYQELARDTLRVFAPQIVRTPGSLPAMALALSEYLQTFGPEDPSAIPGLAQTPDTPPATTPLPTQNEPLMPLAVMQNDPAATQPHRLTASAYLDRDRLQPGQPCRVAIVIDVAEGWHINANPPSPDFVIPTTVSIPVDTGYSLSDMSYPEGRELMIEGFSEAVLVYEGRVILRGVITPSADLEPGERALELQLRYQACNDQVCTSPMRVQLSGRVMVGGGTGELRLINRTLFPDQERQE